MSHERCATHTLHLIAAKDIDQARSQNNLYRKLHDAASYWKGSRFPMFKKFYYNCIKDILTVQQHLNETLRKLDLPHFKDNEIDYLTEYISCLKPIADAIQSLEGKNDTYHGYLLPELMRIQRILSSLEPKYYDADDSSVTSNGTTGDFGNLQAFQYLKDTNYSLSSLNKYPSVEKVFLQHNTCLPSSAPLERLFSFGGIIMRPHKRKLSDALFAKLVILKSKFLT
ncbi:hypothetical protein ILUMI_13766 [Ignelater luminosus]|uniref:HAT C-terminal dimerisation domain-containing protein n=1 Tax=Ignelater luminosus TaxID=2038154 RepID=A0A8K0GB45_IGNLU|nr:hypothetical protein ILUMI_13766 [Ignelater luminosus]